MNIFKRLFKWKKKSVVFGGWHFCWCQGVSRVVKNGERCPICGRG